MTVPTSFPALELAVIRWGEARSIIPNSSPTAQLLKAFEEMGELASATAKNRPDAIKDGVGDVVVTLIMFCALQDIDLTSCLALAYEQIKDRKGHMSPEGIFIKQE
jgi:NTP pyrophosphatase (non-canonical NTP hydrolase)